MQKMRLKCNKNALIKLRAEELKNNHLKAAVGGEIKRKYGK